MGSLDLAREEPSSWVSGQHDYSLTKIIRRAWRLPFTPFDHSVVEMLCGVLPRFGTANNLPYVRLTVG